MSSYNFKVVLLGQGCVGKTSLVLRYVSDLFNDSHQSTLQASFLKKRLYLDQDLVQLNIWDTAGQEKFHALGPIYYREAHGALLVYDVTSPDSLRKVRDWVKELNKMLGKDNVRLAIIGNKVDLLAANEQKNPQNNVIIREAMQFTNELMNAKHYLTSAKLNQGIGEAFTSLSKRMIEQQVKRQQQAASRNDESFGARSRKLMKTISVADDERQDNNDNYNYDGQFHGGLRSSRGIDLNSSNQRSGSCQCWK